MRLWVAVAVPFGALMAGALSGPAVAAGALSGPAAGAAVSRIQHAAGLWIEVQPDAAEAGAVVTVRADCGADNTVAVTAASTALGTITLRPSAGLLHARVQVSSSARPGAHSVTLTCGPGRGATSTMWVLDGGAVIAESTVGPATGGGALAAGPRTAADPRTTTDPRTTAGPRTTTDPRTATGPRTGVAGVVTGAAALSVAVLALVLPVLVPALRRRVR
jgi:hypothetical protein